MKHSLLVVVSGIALLSSAAQASDFDFGVGVGPQYSGVGVSSKYFPSKSSALGLSAGCISFSSTFGHTCGAGLSYERTDLFSASSDQHSFGLYLGLSGSEFRLSGNRYDDEAVYGGALFYTFYFEELSQPGLHIGAHISTENRSHSTEVDFGINLGYRF